MLNIPLSFLLPIFLVVAGARIAAIMSMPETPVYKDGNFFVQKHEIRMALNRVVTAPSFYSVILKKRY